MGFIDNNRFPLINEEQKLRIPLSHRATVTMKEDMTVFKVAKQSTFINTVFRNFKYEAKSSISIALQEKKVLLNRLFTGHKKSSESISEDTQAAIQQLLDYEKKNLEELRSSYDAPMKDRKIFHIDNDNYSYLIDDCEENEYYSRPGSYFRCVIEEYCALPFIERERIYKKDIYEMVERACKEKSILKLKVPLGEKEQIFYVYPYKIAPDPFYMQSYLVCYSRKAEENDNDKKIVSFSMARLNKPTELRKSFHLNTHEIAKIEKALMEDSPAYLLDKSEIIQVKFTEKGKQIYHSKLYSRPERKSINSSGDIYEFVCTQQQAFNYFFSFGPEVEIISPEKLRERFQTTYQTASARYE